MRLLPGGLQTVAMESISGRMLMDVGINNPDFIPTIFRLFKDDESSLISLLDIKGLKTKDINFTTNNANYRTVGSNHIQYAIANTDMRKIHFKANALGLTYKDDANATKIGYGQQAFYVYVDSNWFGFQEIIELADNRTYLYILKDPEEDTNGTWKLKVKVWTNDPEDYVDAELLGDEREIGQGYSAHEQDFSERSVEKYTFDGWGDAYLTLQRFKYSWSGTAKAMKVSGKWAIHNGEQTFITKAEIDMMRRAAQYLEYQILFGKTTVHQDTNKVVMRNEQGREVLAGNGIMYGGDGPIDIPYNTWTKKFMEALFMNIDSYITYGSDGHREVVALLAPQAYLNFEAMMRDLGVTINQNIVGDGAEKGIIDTYSFYELGGIRIIAKKCNWFSQQRRPGIPMPDGTYSNQWDGILLPLGLATGGNEPAIQLVQLRPSSKGTIAGLDEGGNIASSVDGSSTHMLFQNGVISVLQPIRIYKPYYAQSNSVYITGQRG
jgi:hypothetical protein